MRKLSLSEIKQRQIKMLEFFDTFCRKQEIPYFLSYGTLLGAIRHKGYIPWDDDIDVMVPRPYINKLIESFPNGIYRIITIENTPDYAFPYPRMVDTYTYSKDGIFAKSQGVNIDIYPIDAYPNDKGDEEEYRAKVISARRKRLWVLKWLARLKRYMALPNLPLARGLVRKHQEALSSADYSTSERVHAFQLETAPMEKEWFSKACEVEFEGYRYMAPYKWDLVLKNWYGDYMQLPPEDERHPYHGNDNIYAKD